MIAVFTSVGVTEMPGSGFMQQLDRMSGSSLTPFSGVSREILSRLSSQLVGESYSSDSSGSSR
jgi:hypothetical protein